MPESTTGGDIEGQVAATGSSHEGNNPSTSSNPRSSIADNPGAVGPLIIYLSDDDDNEEKNRIVQTRSFSEVDSSVRTAIKPTDPGDDTQRYYRTPCGRQLRSIPDVQRFLDTIPRHRRQGVNLSQFSFTTPTPGPNLQKRAFQKVGPVWKRVGGDAERQSSQPAIAAGERSSSRPSVYANPEPLAVVDPTGRPVPKKARRLSTL